MNLHYEFVAPQRDENIKILQADSFRFWNYSSTKDAFCRKKYAGPRYVLKNLTNDCFKEVSEYLLKENSLMTFPCTEEKKRLEVNGKLFHEEKCSKVPEFTSTTVQIKQIMEDNRIYCDGFTITVEREYQMFR